MTRKEKRPRHESSVATADASVQRASQQQVTIRDVAAAAGVSPMTVSNVINGNRQFVGEDTRQRVLRVIEKMNYRVLSSGRNLRLGRRQAIGVIIVDEQPDFMSHPYISRMVSGLCGVLNAKGYIMVVQGIHPNEFASTFAMRRAEVDAYCVRLHGSEESRARMLASLARLQEPVALIQETLPLTAENHCVVRQDDYGAGLLMADHLAARGIESLQVLVPRFHGPMVNARLRGLEDGFRAAGKRVEIGLLQCETSTFASAYDAVDLFLQAKPLPDAFLGMNDDLAIGALRSLQDRRVNVPKGARVAGFNGFNPPAFTRPSLTTIVSPASEVGAALGETLVSRLSSGRFNAKEILLPVVFRKGAST
jgi:LacI family transcriptional regulator